MRHHLVVLHEKYLRLMTAGRKRIECRLSTTRRAPFEAVSPGDLLWFKVPSGPIRAIGMAGRCAFSELADPAQLARFVKPHRRLIQADEDFLKDAATWARYISLVWIESVVRIQPMELRKSDQRAWIVLNEMPYPMMRIGPERSSPKAATPPTKRVKARA